MRAGSLDRLIDIQEKMTSVSDSGAVIETWVTCLARRAASYRPLKGEERYSGPGVSATEQVEFKIRYTENVSALSPLNRLIYPAPNEPNDEVSSLRVWNILAVNELGRREALAIIAERRPDAAS